MFPRAIGMVIRYGGGGVMEFNRALNINTTSSAWHLTHFSHSSSSHICYLLFVWMKSSIFFVFFGYTMIFNAKWLSLVLWFCIHFLSWAVIAKLMLLPLLAVVDGADVICFVLFSTTRIHMSSALAAANIARERCSMPEGDILIFWLRASA